MASVMYQVTVDTSAVSGTNGLIDFQFNPGTGAATAEIANFDPTDGTLLGPLPPPDPNVTGALPGTVVIANTSGLNAYTEQFTFGASFDFLLTLAGDLSGSRFSLGLYTPGFGTALLTVDDNFIALIDISGDGTINEPVTFAQPNNGPAAATFTVVTGAVPEPSTLPLCAVALVGICMLRKVRPSLWPTRYSRSN